MPTPPTIPPGPPAPLAPLADEAEAGLFALLEQMDQGVIMVGADLSVLAINGPLYALFGQTRAFMPGAGFDGLVRALADLGEYGPGDPATVAARQVEQAMRADPPWQEHRRPNGRVLEIRTRRTPTGGFVRTYTDITERKRAEEDLAGQRELLRLTLENMGQGIALLDRDLRFITHNAQAAEILGIPEPVMRTAPSLEDVARFQLSTGRLDLPPDAPDLGNDLEAKVRYLMDHLGRPERETVYARPQADGRFVEVRIVPLPDGGQVRTYTDVTARKRAEAELRDAQTSLIQAEKLASLAQLVAGVAHEVNTPIGVTLTAISHLDEEVRRIRALFEDNRIRRTDLQGFLEVTWETTRMILANIERAGTLIQSFRQVAVDQASGERRAFDLAAYVDEVLLSLRPRLRRGKVTVETDIAPDLTVDGYPGAFAQVLSNLVINALVHAYDEGQEGRILLSAREEPAGWVAMRYADDGKGIPAAIRDRVFEPFFTTRRGLGASGLGLSICRNIMTATMGGGIAMESAEGRGTRFLLRFPLRAAPG